ncbi:MAG: UDP-N-acetylmuramate dehydrogenase [Bacteroidetes bacterium]|nr:UDP-N-acetylmuramate dehydrogenase [Bacteroidota bacterium]MBL6943758.1 UDP-N-acetylmuramate dehydrogenase [Bacteroidales bacterium]
MLIKQDFCLSPFNTFGVEIMARRLSIITSESDLQVLYNAGELKESKVLVLSKGSNILFTNHFEGLVLLNQIWGKKIIKEEEDHVFLEASSGEFWPSLVEFTVENGWCGLENMTDIPGKVGAAPIQNIGAYGVELKDVLVSLNAFNLFTGEFVKFTNSDCEFSYRSSIFKTTLKNRYFITSVLFKLSKKTKLNLSYMPLAESFANVDINEVTITDVSKKVAEIRRSKLPNPDKLKNAGSFFKNPIVTNEMLNVIKSKYPTIPSNSINQDYQKLHAAWLIEQCGFKGKRKGNVGVYEKHALIIVNHDKATGNEILEFAKSIQKSVFDKFGVQLEFEVNVV